MSKKASEKMKLGIDLTNIPEGERVLFNVFNKLETGLIAIGIASVKLTNQKQLISATFKAMTKGGREVEVQIKKTTAELLAYTEAALRTSKGQIASYKGSHAISGFNWSGEKPVDTTKLTQKREYEDWITQGKTAWSKKLACEKQDLEKWARLGTAAWAKKLATEKRDLENWIAQGKVAWAKKHADEKQNLIQQRRDMEMYNKAGAPTYFDKLFNQAAAITTGIVISQVFMRITSAMTESVNQASKFQIKMSEIRTLSQENQMSLGAWSKEVRGLSDAFGADIFDTAEGLYETLSNQIAKGAEATQFMSDSMRFAAVTVTSTQNAVDLLSSGINAYGLTTHQTNEIAASFFKLIDLGRVRADEIANSIGTVYAISSKLGVTMNETNAALATMTLQGVKADNAMTYLRNIFIAMLKPTKALKETFASWGVASGTAAIETYGFVGVIRKLDEIVQKGGLDELSESLNRIRALLGGALLTGKNTASYEATLAKFEKASGAYAEATKIAFESSGKIIQIELQKIKNLFLEGFGTRVIDSLAATSKMVGGLSNFIEKMSKALVAATAAWAAHRIAVTLNTVAMLRMNVTTAITSTRFKWLADDAIVATTGGLKRLAGSFLALLTPMNLVAIAVAAIVYEIMNTTNSFDDLAVKIKEVEGEMSASNIKIKEDYQKMGRGIQKGLNESFTTIFQQIASTRSKMSELANNIKDKFKETNDSLKDFATKFVDAITEKIRDLKSEVSQLTQMAKESINYSRNFSKKRSDNAFEDSIEDLSTPRKAEAEYQRAESRFTKAQQLYAAAKQLLEAGSIGEANEVFKNARAMFEEALTLADRAQKNNAKGVKEYAKEIVDLDKEIEQTKKKMMSEGKKLDDLWKFGKNTPKNVDRFQDSREQFIKIKKHFEELQEQKAQLVGTGTKETLRDQETRVLAEQRKIEEEILHAEREMQQIVKKRAEDREREIKVLEANKKTARDMFKEALDTKFTGKDTEEQKSKKLEEFYRLREDITTMLTTGKFDLNFGQELDVIKTLSEKERLLERELEAKQQISEIDKTRSKLEKEKEQYTKQITDVSNSNMTRMDDFNGRVTKVIAAIGLMKEKQPFNISDLFTGNDSTIIEKLSNAVPNLMSENIQTRASALQNILPLLIKAEEQFKTDVLTSTGKKRNDISLQATQAIIEAKQALGQSDTINQDTKELQRLKDYYDQMFKEIEESNQASNSRQVQSTRQMVDSMIKEYQRLNVLVAVPTTPIEKGALPPQAPAGYAFGGFARGLDTIPAMLSPGEFVVNSSATRRFYSQLVAMNSGGVRHMASGGYVSNQQFGDINVNVKGGQSATVTARDIGLALRRELKRGTLPPL